MAASICKQASGQAAMRNPHTHLQNRRLDAPPRVGKHHGLVAAQRQARQLGHCPQPVRQAAVVIVHLYVQTQPLELAEPGERPPNPEATCLSRRVLKQLQGRHAARALRALLPASSAVVFVGVVVSVVGVVRDNGLSAV